MGINILSEHACAAYVLGTNNMSVVNLDGHHLAGAAANC